MRLLTFLTRLIWVCVLPPLILSAALAVGHLRALEAQRDVEAAELARNTAGAIDRDLGARIAALGMLAASPLVDDPARWSEFYQEALGFVTSFGSHVLLADTARQMRFNTRVPFGTPLPPLPDVRGLAAAPVALATGHPAVGDPFLGPVAQEPLVAVAVPILRAGHPVYVLLTVIETRQFQQRFEDLVVPSDWRLSLLDDRGDVVASRAPTAMPDVGVDRKRVSVKSALSPWTVVLEVPRGASSTTTRETAVALVMMILGATLAGVFGGKFASLRLSRALFALTATAQIPAGEIGIQEIRAVRDRLADEAAARQAALVQQRASERKFRQLFEQAPVPQAIVDQNGVIVGVNARFTAAFGYDRTDLPTLNAWWALAYPDPEYRRIVVERWTSAVARATATAAEMGPVECRITGKDGVERIHVIAKSLVGEDILATFFDVTERGAMEAALRASEAAMKEARRLAGVGNWRWDAGTDTAIWSEEVFQIFGRDPSLPAANFAEMAAFFTPESWARLSVLVHRCLNEGIPYQCDAELVRPDGGRRWIVARTEARRGAGGAIVELLGTIQDITDSKRAELALQATQAEALNAQHRARVAALNLMEDAVAARTRTEAANAALRDSEQRLRVALDAARAGTWEWDLGSDRNRWSEEIWRLYDLVPDLCEPSYETWRAAIHPDHRDRVLALIAEATARVEEFEVEWRVFSASGAPDRWLLSRGRPVRAPDGSLRYIGIVLDVTERKAAEAELAQYREHLEKLVAARTADLQAANDQLSVTQFAMDSVGIGIHWVEVDTGRFLYVNRFAAEMLGYTVDEMLRMRIPDIDEQFDDVKFAQSVGEFSRQCRVAFETVQKTKDGRRIPVDIVLHYRPAGAGVPARFIAFMTDISLRKATEAAREEALNEARRLAHVRREFLANMSHEIRTPLNAVLGLAQIGARESSGGASLQTFNRILDAGQGLLGVVDDILDFSKIESGRMSLEIAPIILGDVIDRSVRTVAVRACARQLRFRVEEDLDLPMGCQGDSKRIEQILLNLQSNAVKFTPPGGLVVLSAARAGDQLLFRVVDTGIGIAPDAVERLFQPFEQADGSTTRQFGGTGLGLSISRTLVELMGGTITVRSTPGDGSTFEVRLPLVGAVPRAPAPADPVALFGLPADEVASLTRVLAGCCPVEDLDRIPEAAVMIVADGASLKDATVQCKVEGELARGRPVAVVAAPDRGEIPRSLWDRVTVIERPLRARHLVSALSAPRQAIAAVTGSEPRARLVGLSILAAEDNEINRLVLEDMLCSEGARLASFGNGRLALDHLRQRGAQAFDLVITDIQMPEMDGYDLARAVTSLAGTLPVIGLTAHAMEAERRRCLEAGMAECVVKPVNHDVLVTTVLRHTKPNTGGPTVRANPPLVDLQKLKARYGNRNDFIGRLIATVVNSHRETAQTLRAAAGGGNLERIGQLAHAVKGTAGTLVASELQALASRVERAARQSDADAIELAVGLAAAVEAMLSNLGTPDGDQE